MPERLQVKAVVTQNRLRTRLRQRPLTPVPIAVALAPVPAGVPLAVDPHPGVLELLVAAPVEGDELLGVGEVHREDVVAEDGEGLAADVAPGGVEESETKKGGICEECEILVFGGQLISIISDEKGMRGCIHGREATKVCL